MTDLALYETGDGGDAVLLSNDVELTSAIFNMVYLAFFGGNPGAPTTGNENEGELRADWWGNALLFNNDESIQFNSSLEHALDTTALTSAGRVAIEEAAKKDLEFISELANVEVSVVIDSDNKVSIFVTLIEPSNLEEKSYQIIWDATKKEVIEVKEIN